MTALKPSNKMDADGPVSDVAKIALDLAMWHGAKMTVHDDDGQQTVASRAGFGRWGHSPQLYAERHWREYLQAAESVIERITNAVARERTACAKIARAEAEHQRAIYRARTYENARAKAIAKVATAKRIARAIERGDR